MTIPTMHQCLAHVKQPYILNSDRATCTLFTPDHAEYNTRLNLQLNSTILDMHTHPKILDFILDPKLTTNTLTTQQLVSNTIPIQSSLKPSRANQETLLSTYKVVTRAILKYASSLGCAHTADGSEFVDKPDAGITTFRCLEGEFGRQTWVSNELLSI